MPVHKNSSIEKPNSIMTRMNMLDEAKAKYKTSEPSALSMDRSMTIPSSTTAAPAST